MEVEVIADGDGEMEGGMHSPVSSGELFGGGGKRRICVLLRALLWLRP